MDLGIAGKRALVCGASSGLGRAAAVALAQEGVRVTINSRSREKLEKQAEVIKAETGETVGILAGDVSDRATVERFADSVREVDILVSNAGGPPSAQFSVLDDETWDQAHSLVLSSAVRLTRLVLDGMLNRKWGRLIYITSVGVRQPIDSLILSNTYRSAVTAFCKTISNNYARFGITANCVCPGYTATQRLEELARVRAESSGIRPEDVLREYASDIPAARVGRPDELAALIAFLASEKAAYITGSSISVDGGFVKGLI